MSFIDWLLVILPLFAVGYIGFKTQRYTKDLSDFLSGGRVAGRYVLAVSGGQAMFGLISLVALFEMYYKSGFAIGFWNTIVAPISIIIALTGFVVYRYRETRAMTLSQFFEIRYSRKFRLFTGFLQALTGIINYGLFPAVGARFIVYFTNMPLNFEFAGLTISTYAFVMFIFLTVAVIIAVLGGQVTIMVTDCLQGLFSYPMYLIVVLAIIFSFSWWDHFVPIMSNRPPGESFIDPFDTYNLRDFNLFYIFVGIFAGIYNIRSWQGAQGYNAAAISPHEQKMAGVLGAWRGGFSGMMYIFLAMAALAYMQHSDFKDRAAVTERNIQWKTLNDVAYDQDYLAVESSDELIQERLSTLNAKQKQVFDTISSQMRVPVALRDILPVGVTGLFCAIMIFLMISTDTTYLHSWGSIIVQDAIMPFRKKHLDPKKHLLHLRLAIVGVAVYAFIFSLFFGQVTYILMFFALTGSIWLGGAGAVIIGGLYWKKATTAGAWTSLIIGAVMAVAGFICTQYWVSWIYPAISQTPETLAWVTRVFEGMSRPFEPIIMWRVTPDKFPVNGQEIFFLTMLFSILSYVIVSLLTCKEPFNMDRMLHRGIYRRKDDSSVNIEAEKSLSLREKLFKTFLGIDSQYTKGDKILAWSVFLYSFVWGFGTWVIIVIWNLCFQRWSIKWWATWQFITYYIIAVAIGVISTVWFSIGTTIDLKKLFKRLAARQRNEQDDGRVIGHINADEIETIEQIENRVIEDEE